MKKYILYKLIDPIDNEIKYIGYTSRTLKSRMRDHINSSKLAQKKGKLNKKQAWIISLLNKNTKPIIEAYFYFDTLDAVKIVEKWMIYQHGGMDKLKNGTTGGDGVENIQFSDEALEKMKPTQFGNKPAWNKGLKGAQTPWNKGIKNCFSEETKNKMSESAKKRGQNIEYTEEVRNKISSKLKGNTNGKGNKKNKNI